MNSFVFTKHVSASSIPQQPQSVVWWAMGPLQDPPGLSRYLGSLGACSVAPPRRPRISQPGPRHHWVSPLSLQHAAGSHPIESAGGGGGNGQLHENRKRGEWHFKEVHTETLLARLGNTMQSGISFICPISLDSDISCNALVCLVHSLPLPVHSEAFHVEEGCRASKHKGQHNKDVRVLSHNVLSRTSLLVLLFSFSF